MKGTGPQMFLLQARKIDFSDSNRLSKWKDDILSW